MAAAGFFPAPPATPDPGMGRWAVRGAGLLPLALRIAAPLSGPPAALLMLAEAPGRAMDSEEVELTRMPLVGTQVPPLLWICGSNAWLIAGSVLASRGEPLHRLVGVRRASLGRGEAMLHNQHGLADYGAGELDAARREFDRALLADPRFVDALYNAASVAALEDRADAAVALLQRAAAEDFAAGAGARARRRRFEEPAQAPRRARAARSGADAAGRVSPDFPARCSSAGTQREGEARRVKPDLSRVPLA